MCCNALENVRSHQHGSEHTRVLLAKRPRDIHAFICVCVNVAQTRVCCCSVSHPSVVVVVDDDVAAAAAVDVVCCALSARACVCVIKNRNTAANASTAPSEPMSCFCCARVRGRPHAPRRRRRDGAITFRTYAHTLGVSRSARTFSPHKAAHSHTNTP